jgi:hypothetical protein
MKYMLMLNYEVEGIPPMSEWTEDEARALHEHMNVINRELEERGEAVDGQGLAESAETVISDGQGAPVVTDGPYPESKELLAGFWIVDVESRDRAIEIAAKASAAPGPGGKPIKQPIEVREVMSEPPSEA